MSNDDSVIAKEIVIDSEKEYAVGWLLFRFSFVLVAIINLVPRFNNIPYLFCEKCLRLTSGFFNLNDYYPISVFEAKSMCLAAMLSLLISLLGGRLFHIGIFAWLLLNFTLLSSQAINIKAYDRLLLWLGVALLISPAYKSGLINAYVYKYPRMLIMVVFSALYLSTGILKLVYEPGWFDGSAMAYHLNNRWHAGGDFALWLSTQRYLLYVMGIFTILFECGAGVLLWFKKINPYVILVGIVFHLSIEALMNVGTFSLVVLCAYPVLIEPSMFFGLVRTFKRSD